MRPSERSVSALLVTFLGALVFLGGPAIAQPPSSQLPQELIVLLAPSPPGPDPEAVVHAVNNGRAVPGGLGEGNPTHGQLMAERATGRLLRHITEHPDSPEALLQRYVLLRFPDHVNLDGIATALSHNPNVRNVEKNLPLRYHVSRVPAKSTVPADSLVGTGASFPQDAQWALHLLNLPAAWDWTTGHGYIGMLDQGLQVNHEDLKTFGTDPVTGQLVFGPYRPLLSEDVAWVGCGVDEREEGHTSVGHGSHVSGIVAGRADNHRGVAGACWDCSIEMIRMEPSQTHHLGLAAAKLLTSGVAGVSMSFGLSRGPCDPDDPNSLCTNLQLLANRDVLLFASAGNDLAGVEFPANDSKVIGVGGLEWIASQGGQPVAQVWSEEPSCPLPTNPVPTAECGSNFGPELDLVAPAKTVISTMYTGYNYNTTLSCGDSFLSGFPGYGPCTGTSMSAPYVAGIGMLVRSLNPLLTRTNVYDILTSTASEANNRTDQLGFGYPDAEAAVRRALGTVGGETLRNRLTPLFSFFGTSDNPDPVTNPNYHLAEDWAYTTVPSVASSLLLPQRPVDSYQTDGSTLVPGYTTFPGITSCEAPCDTLPRASVYVFTTNKAPYLGAPELVPIYRLRYDPDIHRFCDFTIPLTPARDVAYVTTPAEVQSFKNSLGYELDGIDGYLYKPCEGQPGCSLPPGTVKIHRAYNATRQDYAIFPASELTTMQNDGYTGQTTVLGYAYLNVDSDSDTLIDGFETLLGTNPTATDTDCDGVSDGVEVLSYDETQHQYGDPLDGPCGPIFADGFELGSTSRWSAAITP